MALVKKNDLTSGFSGRFGDIMFKQIGKKTYAFPTPQRPKKESEKQRTNRDKFRDATAFAHLMMENAEKKAYYQKVAKKLKLPNAYTAAITDYMRNPEISSIDARRYNGRPEGEIMIFADKKDIKVERVDVVISSPENEIIEYGPARRSTVDSWVYDSKLPERSRHSSYRIMITASDSIDRSVTKTFVAERIAFYQ